MNCSANILCILQSNISDFRMYKCVQYQFVQKESVVSVFGMNMTIKNNIQ